MDKRVVLIALICIADFVASQQCDLAVAPKQENFFIRKLKEWFGFLKKEVETSDTHECHNCSLIRPDHQTSVATERDKKVGCRCQISSVSDKFQCACCFKIWRWDFLICAAVGFFFKSSDVFVVLTLEDHVVFKFNISLGSEVASLITKLLTCVPLPPPVEFLSACFRPTIERPSFENDYMWKLCGKLKLGLFQIPVIQLYMKCFNIKDSHDMMMIEGQSHPHDEVHEPARTEVRDKNYNPVVCLSNEKKEEAITCKDQSRSGRQVSECKKRKFVEIRERINWVESKLGETPYLAVLHQKNYPMPVKHLTEDDKFPFIKNAMKRAEDQQWMNLSDHHVFKQPGRSCGGALLTPNKVLTICACVRSFYIVNKLKQEPGEDIIFPFDIQSFDIFLDIPGITYTAAEDFRLDTNSDKFMSDSLCAKLIASNNTWLLQTMMIVMPFTPEIAKPDPGQFVPWPPLKAKTGQAVTMVGFGMELRDRNWFFRSASGETIDFDATAVNFFLKQCDLTSYSMSEIKKDKFVFDFTGRVAGFCSANSKWQLCHGKIGFPLTAEGGLVGLASLPVDCLAEGSIAGAIFDPVTMNEIENYLENSAYAVNTLPQLKFLLSAMIMAEY